MSPLGDHTTRKDDEGDQPSDGDDHVVMLLAGDGPAVVTTNSQGDVLSWADANTKIQLILSSSNNEPPKTVVKKVAGKLSSRPQYC